MEVSVGRVNIYAKADEDSGGGGYDRPALLGWFDPAVSEAFKQGKEFDGSNMVGVITGSEWIDEYLYRTPRGRWVRNHDAHRYMGGADTYEFITDEEAKDWLIRSEVNDEAVARFFGEVPDEEDRRPGRPTVGGRVSISLGEDLLPKIDAYAARHGVSRAEAVRQFSEAALTAWDPEAEANPK